jgi:hypothetical protein
MDIKTICQKLKNSQQVSIRWSPPNINEQKQEEENDKTKNIVIEKIDIENLANFVKIWTDVYNPELIEDLDNKSFENEKELYNLGFFTIKVNSQCSPTEFLGLLIQIPFEQFFLPGTDQISYAQLHQIFGENSEKLIIQLMVLGDYFKYWQLINPYSKMVLTQSNIKLLLSGMGSFAILLVPGYLEKCYQLVKDLHPFIRVKSK